MRGLLFIPLVLLLILIISSNKPNTNTMIPDLLNETEEKDSISIRKDSISEFIVLENDSVVISMKLLPCKDEWSPCPTEIWVKNKDNDISRLLVKSNPDSCYGKKIPYRYENDFQRLYPLDSIPTICRCIPIPNTTQLIIDGPTCDAGWIAAFKIDWVTGKCYVLPSNDGFKEFEDGSNNIIVASRFNDIDWELVIWYEELTTISPSGKIIKKISTKNQEIENYLPIIHSEAGLKMPVVKLVKHQTLKPKYTDEYFSGNRFDCKYDGWDENIMAELDSLVISNPKWSRINAHYQYEDLDNEDQEFKAFKKIYINSKTKTGIVYKGMFTDKRNVPSLNN